MKQNTKKHRTHAAIQKQVKLHKSCAYDNKLGYNKLAVVIADSLFVVSRHLCFNGYLCDMRHPFKVGFRNKHTANHRRSPINKHLSNIIVFTIRQRKIIRPKTARINIICILHPFHVQNHNYVKYAYRIATVFDCGKRLKAQQSSKKNVRIHKLKILPFFPNISSR